MDGGNPRLSNGEKERERWGGGVGERKGEMVGIPS